MPTFPVYTLDERYFLENGVRKKEKRGNPKAENGFLHYLQALQESLYRKPEGEWILQPTV